MFLLPWPECYRYEVLRTLHLDEKDIGVKDASTVANMCIVLRLIVSCSSEASYNRVAHFEECNERIK